MATNKEILDADVKNAEYILKIESLCRKLAEALKEIVKHCEIVLTQTKDGIKLERKEK